MQTMAARDAVTAENAPLLRIVSRAFNLTDDRVSGPAWIASQCYDIKAKAPRGTPDSDLMPMLQTLLKERFHLLARRESAVGQIYALEIDKGGTKLHPYGYQEAGPPSNNDGKILFLARHLPDLCERLAKVTGHPVVDKTGLDGDYLIELAYLPFGADPSDPADPASDIFSAVRDQLGLKLEAQLGVADSLKIDSVDKVPTRN